MTKSDVDVPVGILKELRCLSFTSAPGRHHGLDELAIERRRPLRASGRIPADHFRRVAQSERRIARVNALRRECEVEIQPHFQSGFFQDRGENLFGRSRICRGLQDHEHAAPQVVGQNLGGGAYRPQIRSTLIRQWRRYANHNCVGLTQLGLVGRRAKSGVEHCRNVRVADIVNVRPAFVERVDNLRTDVEANHLQTSPYRFPREGKTDIPQSSHHKISHRTRPLPKFSVRDVTVPARAAGTASHHRAFRRADNLI